jgi:hypothetical protein
MFIASQFLLHMAVALMNRTARAHRSCAPVKIHPDVKQPQQAAPYVAEVGIFFGL